MKNYWLKFKTDGRSPAHSGVSFSAYSAVGGFLAIAVTAALSQYSETPFLMAPFGATCVLAFGVPGSPLAQPRNIIGGHLVSTLIGLLCLFLFGDGWYSLALGVGASIFLMQLTKTTHPPAGADPLVVIAGAKTIGFLFNPVLSGAIIITLIALFFNNLSHKRKYPTYWK